MSFREKKEDKKMFPCSKEEGKIKLQIKTNYLFLEKSFVEHPLKQNPHP